MRFLMILCFAFSAPLWAPRPPECEYSAMDDACADGPAYNVSTLLDIENDLQAQVDSAWESHPLFRIITGDVLSKAQLDTFKTLASFPQLLDLAQGVESEINGGAFPEGAYGRKRFEDLTSTTGFLENIFELGRNLEPFEYDDESGQTKRQESDLTITLQRLVKEGFLSEDAMEEADARIADMITENRVYLEESFKGIPHEALEELEGEPSPDDFFSDRLSARISLFNSAGEKINPFI